MPNSSSIGSGRFGTCYLATFSHYQVCVKVPKHSQRNSLVSEANIISQFSHVNLPYLFGYYLKTNSIVMSYHGVGDQAITVYDALYPNSNTRELLQMITVDWMDILKQITEGCGYLHNNYKIIHNDIKCDNIALAAGHTSVKAVLIDFGKACQIGEGKMYTLSKAEKEQYKKIHSHIAPDLRDGLCQQSTGSDIFSLGKVLNLVCKIADSVFDSKAVLDISNQCLKYNKNDRPNITQILSIFSS